jgi:hypothetical protein
MLQSLTMQADALSMPCLCHTCCARRHGAGQLVTVVQMKLQHELGSVDLGSPNPSSSLDTPK